MADESQLPHIQITGDGNVLGDGNVVVLTKQYFTGEYERLRDAYIEPWPVFERVNLQHFVGREWLLAEVDVFLRDHDRGYFILEAEAGLGKTTFLAWLVQQRGYIHHFAELVPGLEGVGLGLKNLAAQLLLACHLDRYDTEGIVPEAATRPDYLSRLLKQASDQRPDGQKIVLVIDALDEAGTPQGQNVLGLPEVLPEGVFIIASQRPVPVTLQVETTITSRHPITLSASSENNRADMRCFLEQAATWPGIERALRESGHTIEQFVDVLLEKSGGVWIYLHYVVHEIEQGTRSPTDLDSLPDGITQYYAHYWQRWRNREEEKWYEVYLPLLTTLATAQEAVSFHWLCTLAGIAEGPSLSRLLREEWRPFLTVDDTGSDHRYRLYHSSLKGYLSGLADLTELTEAEQNLTRELADATSRRHRHIAEYCLDQPARWSDGKGYAFRHLHTHAAEVSQDALYTLIERKDWFTAQRSYDLTCENYARGVDYALQFAEQNGVQGLPPLVAYSLLRATIGTLATSVSPGILEAMTYLDQATQALRYASLMVDRARQVDSYLRIAGALQNTTTSSLVYDALDGAINALQHMSEETQIIQRIIPLTDRIATQHYRSGLQRLLSKTDDIGSKRKRREIVTQIAREIIRSDALESLPDVVSVLERMTYPHEPPFTLVDVADDLVSCEYIQQARELLARAHDHAMDMQSDRRYAIALAQVAGVWQKLGEGRLAQELQEQSAAAARALESGEDRARALLKLSRVVEDDKKRALLRDAVTSVRAIDGPVFLSSLIEELGPELASVDDSQGLGELIEIVTDVYSDRDTGRQDCLIELAESVAHIDGIGRALSVLELLPDKWWVRSRVLLSAIRGTRAVPDQASIACALDLMEQMDHDDPYQGEAMEALAPLVAQIGDEKALSRLVDLAVAFSEDRQWRQSRVWDAVASAMLQLDESLEIEDWWRILGRIADPEHQYTALLCIGKTLIAAGRPHEAVQMVMSGIVFTTGGHRTILAKPLPRLARMLAEQGYLDEAISTLELGQPLVCLEPGYTGVLVEVTRQASSAQRLDLLEVIADHAIDCANSRLLELTSSLLAKAGLEFQALEAIRAYVSDADKIGTSHAECEARVVLVKALAQAGEFDLAQSYAEQIRKEKSRERALASIVHWMAHSPNHTRRLKARDLAVALQEPDIQVHALRDVVLGMIETSSRADLHQLLDTPDLTWYTSHETEPARQLVSVLSDNGEFELATEMARKITSDMFYIEAWERITKAVCDQDATDWVPRFLRQIAEREFREDQPLAQRGLRSGSGTQSADSFRDLTLSRRIELRLKMAHLLADMGYKELAQETLASCAPSLRGLERYKQKRESGVWLDGVYKKIAHALIELGNLRAGYTYAREVGHPGEQARILLDLAGVANQYDDKIMAGGMLERAWEVTERWLRNDTREHDRECQQMVLLLCLSELANQCGRHELAQNSLRKAWQIGEKPLDRLTFPDNVLSAVSPLCQAVRVAAQMGLQDEAWAAIEAHLPFSERALGSSMNRHSLVKAFEALADIAIQFKDWDRLEHFLTLAESLRNHEQAELLRTVAEMLRSEGELGRAKALFGNSREAVEQSRGQETRASNWLDTARGALAFQGTPEEVLECLHRATQEALAMESWQGDSSEHIQVDTLLETASRMLEIGYQYEALQVLEKAMGVIQEFHIGYSKWDVWPKLLKLLKRLDDDDTMFRSLLLTQYVDKDWRARVISWVVEAITPVVPRRLGQTAQAISVLLGQARQQGREEVWKCIEALAPLLLQLGGSAFITETWRRINAVEALFQSQEGRTSG